MIDLHVDSTGFRYLGRGFMSPKEQGNLSKSFARSSYHGSHPTDVGFRSTLLIVGKTFFPSTISTYYIYISFCSESAPCQRLVTLTRFTYLSILYSLITSLTICTTHTPVHFLHGQERQRRKMDAKTTENLRQLPER